MREKMVMWRRSEFLASVLMRQSPEGQLPGLKPRIQLEISQHSIQSGKLECGQYGTPMELVLVKVPSPLICSNYMAHVSASDGTADGSDNGKDNSWAVVEAGKTGYPILPEKPLDASLLATRKVLRTWVNKVYRE
jgi:hypothetical protein